MSKERLSRAEDMASVRMREALKALTEEDLRFFPKTDSMLEQAEAPWNRESKGRASVERRFALLSDWDSAHSGTL